MKVTNEADKAGGRGRGGRMNPEADRVWCEALQRIAELQRDLAAKDERIAELVQARDESVSLLTAERERMNKWLAELQDDLAAAKDMIRDLCIGHEDNCVCHCCKSVFR